MQYHIGRNGQQYGPYSLEEINTHLASSTLLPTDLVWGDDPRKVQPLSKFLTFLQSAPAPVEPPPDIAPGNLPPVLSESSHRADSAPGNLPPVLSGSQETGSIPVQICFPGEWMMVDSDVQLLLDGQSLLNFSFINGFNLNTTVSAGAHQLKTVVTLGPITRTKEFQFNCQGTESQLALTLEYSRVWGNFSDLRIAGF